MKFRVKIGTFAALKVPITREKTKTCPVSQLNGLFMMRALVLNLSNFRIFFDMAVSYSRNSAFLEEFYTEP